MNAQPLPPTRDGHRVVLVASGGGMGEDPDYTPHCSCGWTGTTVQPRRFPDDDRAELAAFTPEHATKVAAVGLAAYRTPFGARYGTRQEALTEALAHAGYTRGAHRALLAHPAASVQDLLLAFLAGDDNSAGPLRISAAALIEALDGYADLARTDR